MKILKSDAKLIIQNYSDYGTPNDFTDDDGTQKITGYLFSKTDFLSLFGNPGLNRFYIILGRTKGTQNKPFITPIIGRVKEGTKIDGETLIYCDTPSFQPFPMSSISPDELVMRAQSFIEKNNLVETMGAPINPMDAKRMIDNHLVKGMALRLTLPTGSKVRGYELGESDINYLLDGDEPNRLLIIPALLDINESGMDVVPDHLTLILAWLKDDDSIYTIKMLDYCLPCPNACYEL